MFWEEEPASPGQDTDMPMEVDSSEMNSDVGRGLDDVEEPSPPEDKMFFMDPAELDGDKDEEAVKTIRLVKSRHCTWDTHITHPCTSSTASRFLTLILKTIYCAIYTFVYMVFDQ